MKTLAICLTVVFVTLKAINILPWSWFYCFCPFVFWAVAVLLLSSIFEAWKKYDAKRDQEQNEYRKSKWQQRMDSIRAANEALKEMGEERNRQKPTDTVKSIILLLAACAILHSCTPSYGIMRCPKQPSYTFKK